MPTLLALLTGRHPALSEGESLWLLQHDVRECLDILCGAFEADAADIFLHFIRHYAFQRLPERGWPPLSQDLIEFLPRTLGAQLGAARANLLLPLIERARIGLEQGPNVADGPARLQAWPQAADFEQALLSGDHVAASVILREAAGGGRQLLEAELGVVQPALYSIGEKWSRKQVSIAQEHMATAVAKLVMAQAYTTTVHAPGTGRLAMLSCVEGNQHAVGLRMIGDAFELAGWQIRYLGADLPSDEIVRAAIEYQPDVIGLSASLPRQYVAVRAATQALHQQLGHDCPPIVLGGQAFSMLPGAMPLLGADCTVTDARHAVSCTAQLIARRDHNT